MPKINTKTLSKPSLREGYGLHNLKDKEYNIQCRQIAKNILNATDKDFSTTYSLFVDNAVQGSGFYRMTEFINLSWIKSIDFYIKYVNKGELDSMVVANTVCFKEYNMGYEKIKVLDNVNFEFREDSTKFTNKYAIIPFLKSEDGFIMRGSVIIIIPRNYKLTEEKMFFNVQHELGHFYDVYTRKITFKYLNRDLADKMNDDVPIHIKYVSPVEKDVAKFLTNPSVQIEEKIKMIQSPECSRVAIAYAFGKTIYEINSSEIKQRLINFVFDLSQHTIDEIHNTVTVPNIEKNLIRASSTYSSYWCYATLFRILVKYTPVEIKRRFAEVDIQRCFEKAEYYGDEVDDELEYSYFHKFSKNGIYDENVFDDFFKYHYKRIEKNFLHKAGCIALDINMILNHYSAPMEHYFGLLNASHINEETDIRPYDTIFY